MSSRPYTMEDGEKARAVANHKLNAHSSRSHAVLIVRVANPTGGEGTATVARGEAEKQALESGSNPA